MLVSIIIITHNFENYVEECLKSISNQTYKDIEIIVVDDKSSDNTLEIVKKFAEADSRVRFFQNKENQGKARSFNFAIEKIKGELIVQFDGDDIMPKTRIGEQVDFMRENPDVEMSYGDMIKFDEEGNEEVYRGVEFKQDPLEIMKKSMKNAKLRTDHTWRILDDKKYIPGTSVMMRKIIFEQGIRMDPNIWATTDYDLWLQIIGSGFRIKKARIIGLRYRLHLGQMSKKRDKNPERGYIFNKLKAGKYFT